MPPAKSALQAQWWATAPASRDWIRPGIRVRHQPVIAMAQGGWRRAA